MEDLIRVKIEAGLNQQVTISALGLWTLATFVCFIIGVPDAKSLIRLVWSRNFIEGVARALLVLLPFAQVYVVLLSASSLWFKASRVASVAGTVVLIFVLDRYALSSGLWKWLMQPHLRQHFAAAVAMFAVVSIFEVRVGDGWVSLFYNQRGNRVVTGLITITRDNSMTGILSIAGFVGTMPLRAEPVAPTDAEDGAAEP